MHRLFLPKENFPTISGQAAHQIRNVLRLKPGDQLEIFDGTGQTYHCLITSLSQEKVVFNIVSARPGARELPVRVALAQGVPKGTKMDLIVEKATELGVAEITPLISERVVAKGVKPARWQKIAIEAAEQSGRSIVPKINEALSFGDLLSLAKDFDLALIAWEGEKEKSLRQTLANHQPKKILFVIGPEGGFSKTEAGLAAQAGFVPVSLGKRILRTETAALAILSAINYQYE